MNHPLPSTPDIEDGAAQPTASEPDELIGRVLNETYIIEAVLGQGGVGKVYRARHARIGTKKYALKVLHAEHSRDPQQLARFQREAEAAASLSHPNVVGVFDVGRTDDGYSYLACELLEGIDLDEYMDQKGKLPVATAIHIALQICAALDSAHAQNIIHRDLKPQNVFLLNGPGGTLPELPTVKLVDFGLSRMLDHVDSQLTKTGTLMGTPAYMAPEQATGLRGDHRVDIYGVGIILYAAVTGRHPFLEDTLPAMLVAVMTQDAPRPRKIDPTIPESLELLIQRAMSKKPDDRYRSAADLRAALEAIGHGSIAEFMVSSPARPGAASQAAEEAYELKTSRFRLVYYTLVLVLLTVTILMTGVSGLELFMGPFSFSKTELILILAGICGTIATPVTLVFLHFKRTIWGNSSKVMVALNRVRSLVLTGLLTYGTSALFLRFCDDFLGRLTDSDLFSADPGLGWAGFTWILPTAALIASAISEVQIRLSESPSGPRLRIWLGTPLRVFSMITVAVVLWLGLKWRAVDVAARQVAPAAIAQGPDEKQTTTEAPAPGPATPAPPPVVALATDAELTAALGLGLDGLLPLSEKYPSDPRVIEPLLIEFASRATGYADAMVMTKRLLAVSPEKRSSEKLGLLIRRAAETPGKASELAFELLQKDMGSVGADLLYALAKGASKATETAKTALGEPTVQGHMSPALKIAMELEGAETCEARLPLLERAKQLGDLRAASALVPLAQGSRTGCGKWKNRPCPSRCPEQSKEFLAVAQAIQKRAANKGL